VSVAEFRAVEVAGSDRPCTWQAWLHERGAVDGALCRIPAGKQLNLFGHTVTSALFFFEARVVGCHALSLEHPCCNYRCETERGRFPLRVDAADSQAF
jgi:hypothetical protein